MHCKCKGQHNLACRHKVHPVCYPSASPSVCSCYICLAMDNTLGACQGSTAYLLKHMCERGQRQLQRMRQQVRLVMLLRAGPRKEPRCRWPARQIPAKSLIGSLLQARHNTAPGCKVARPFTVGYECCSLGHV